MAEDQAKQKAALVLPMIMIMSIDQLEGGCNPTRRLPATQVFVFVHDRIAITSIKSSTAISKKEESIIFCLAVVSGGTIKK